LQTCSLFLLSSEWSRETFHGSLCQAVMRLFIFPCKKRRITSVSVAGDPPRLTRAGRLR
jgi:hypothetical protein